MNDEWNELPRETWSVGWADGTTAVITHPPGEHAKRLAMEVAQELRDNPGVALPPGWNLQFFEPPTQDVSPERAIRYLLDELAGDPCAESLNDTPATALAAWRDLTSGYDVDVEELLLPPLFAAVSTYAAGMNFVGMCQVHLLPFIGSASLAYTANVGLTRDQFTQLVQTYARRLTTPAQMADALTEALFSYVGQTEAAVAVLDVAHCVACSADSPLPMKAERVVSTIGDVVFVEQLMSQALGEA